MNKFIKKFIISFIILVVFIIAVSFTGAVLLVNNPEQSQIFIQEQVIKESQKPSRKITALTTVSTKTPIADVFLNGLGILILFLILVIILKHLSTQNEKDKTERSQ